MQYDRGTGFGELPVPSLLSSGMWITRHIGCRINDEAVSFCFSGFGRNFSYFRLDKIIFTVCNVTIKYFPTCNYLARYIPPAYIDVNRLHVFGVYSLEELLAVSHHLSALLNLPRHVLIIFSGLTPLIMSHKVKQPFILKNTHLISQIAELDFKWGLFFGWKNFKMLISLAAGKHILYNLVDFRYLNCRKTEIFSSFVYDML